MRRLAYLDTPNGRVQIRPSGGYKIELLPPKLKLVWKIENSKFFSKKFKKGRKIVFRPEKLEIDVLTAFLKTT